MALKKHGLTNSIMNNYISGNKGFIATHLQNIVEADGHDLKNGGNSILINNVEKKYDVVYHLGAHLQPTDDSDIKLHRAVYEYCKRTGAYLVYASSAAIYNPTSLYAVQKLYGEALFKDIPHTTLRFFNVYGEGGSGIVDKIKRGEHIKINGNGTQTRDYIHVYDVCQAIKTAGENKIEGTFDVGTGIDYSVNDLIELVEHNKWEFVTGETGVLDSVANPSARFPWISTKDVYHDYLRTA